jgi:hypothetical protein
MRVQRPSWFEPVRGPGEWVGFLGGILVAAGLGVFGFLLVRGIADTLSVSVRNDSHLTVIVRDCGSDASFIEPGEAFRAEGLPEHDQVTCLVSYYEGQERCMATPRVRSIKGTIALSQLTKVRRSRCD